MKWPLIILTVSLKIISNLNENKKQATNEVKQYIEEKSSRFVILLSVLWTLTTLFSSGIVISVYNLSLQLDAGNNPKLNAIIEGGLWISSISFIVFIAAISFSDLKKESRQETRPLKPSILEESIGILINELLKEKENIKSEVQQTPNKETENLSEQFNRFH